MVQKLVVKKSPASQVSNKQRIPYIEEGKRYYFGMELLLLLLLLQIKQLLVATFIPDNKTIFLAKMDNYSRECNHRYAFLAT
jgi:hypothetical protein